MKPLPILMMSLGFLVISPGAKAERLCAKCWDEVDGTDTISLRLQNSYSVVSFENRAIVAPDRSASPTAHGATAEAWLGVRLPTTAPTEPTIAGRIRSENGQLPRLERPVYVDLQLGFQQAWYVADFNLSAVMVGAGLHKPLGEITDFHIDAHIGYVWMSTQVSALESRDVSTDGYRGSVGTGFDFRVWQHADFTLGLESGALRLVRKASADGALLHESSWGGLFGAWLGFKLRI
jgi:hypothetical protein